ncbi:MAG: zinc ribbon domain-containing protein [Chloroflexota bacterium]|nr:zinc ribbon domain-containing protein [Chloroflexota bacterium]
MQDEKRDARNPEQVPAPDDHPTDAPVPDEPAREQPAVDHDTRDEHAAEPATADNHGVEQPSAEEVTSSSWPTAEYESAPPVADERALGEHPADVDEPGVWPSTPPSEAEAFDAASAGDWSEEGASAEAVGAAASAHSVPATEVGESTQCPRCGTENRPGIAFCRNCGQRLIAAGVAATVERPGAPEGTQSCPRCGTHNRAGVAFCQNCGANLRPATEGYIPPAVVGAEEPEPARAARRSAVLGPVVLLIGAIGLATAYLLPFAIGGESLFTQAFGTAGYGPAFWSAYPGASSTLAQQAYFGFAAPAPILIGLLVLLAIGGFVRAAPRTLQTIGLLIALLWAVGLIVLFVMVEVAGSWHGDLVGMLRDLSPAGIIFFLAGLIVLIGTLTRFAKG